MRFFNKYIVLCFITMAYSVFIHNFFEFFFSVNSSVPYTLVLDIAIDRCVVDKL